MDFLDSFFDKIPIIRDMDKKKRILAAGLVIFALVSILGILIDAIAEAGGVVALIAVAIGFLLMAALIIADFILSRRAPQKPAQQEPYAFFDDSPDDFDYQDESYGYASDEYASDQYPPETMPQDDRYDEREYGDSRFPEPDYQEPDRLEADLTEPDRFPPQPEQERATGRFGVFRRGRQEEPEAPSVPDPRDPELSPAAVQPRDDRFSFRAEPAITQPEPQPVEPAPSSPRFNGNIIGQPVMTFSAQMGRADEEVALTAAAVAPGIVVPPPQPDVIGGPVMSIPFRGASAPQVTQTAPAYTPPATPVTTFPAPAAPAPVTGTSAASTGRGKEIEQFFDNMSDDELLYSDCVEVWASDAKPAAIRLLKLVESLNDKKMADSLGREAEYVNAMLDRIYYFTMLDSIKDNLELKKYNFSAMVKECLRRFSPFFMEKRIGLLWKGLDIDIVTDRRWLIFALTQVVFNAVEFTGLGGKIAISAKKQGNMIHLMVDDSGCGISDEDLPHIFMAGFMGDNVPNESGRRTGMGLFITRSVVEKLGGTVTAESTVGKGTRITMILPEKP